MKVLSLFSGVGGFDLGLERAGMETVFQCEWDKHATEILERHWPDVPRWDDVSTLTGKHILAHAPVIDIVAWGSPCQDLSVAGKRAGLEGSRSGLFHEGIRIIKELRKETNNVYPRISLWENVYGALNSNKGADFGVILDEMAEAGSLVQEWRVLDAQYFGVPQRRRRVFLVSVFNTATAARCPNPLLPVSESVRRDTPTSGTPGQEPTGTTPESVASRGKQARLLGSNIVGSLNAVDYKWPQNQQLDENKFVVVGDSIVFDDDRRVGPRIFEQTVGTLQAFMGTGGNNTPMVAQAIPMLSFDTQFGSNANVFENQSPTLKASQAAPSVAYGIQGNVIGRQDHNGPAGKGHTNEGDPMYTLTGTDIHAVAYTLREREGKPGGGKGPLVTPEKSGTLAAGGNDKTVFQYDGYNQRIYQDDVSVTIRIGRDSSDFVAQPAQTTMAVRRLTPIECERLMGWPDGWTEGQADTHRYKQCGNGVASPVATWIGQQLINL
jgi:DNA (cytosine-5)-methyltransferase 1